MSGSHVWAAVLGAIVASAVFVLAPLFADLRPLGAERRWSKLKRQQRRDIDRLARKGTP